MVIKYTFQVIIPGFSLVAIFFLNALLVQQLSSG